MIAAETPIANGWTHVLLRDGRQRAYKRLAHARLNVFDCRWATRPRIEWDVYDATGNEVLARGEAESMDAAYSAADAALAALEGQQP